MLAPLFLFFNIVQAIVVAGPSGPWSVSHQVVELTDESRWDPYAPENGQHKRRILTSLFLPTQKDLKTCHVEKIDYMLPNTRGRAAKALGLPNTTFEGLELEFCKASSGAREPLPIVIFSPGFSSIRLFSSVQAQSLASQGNVVITVDHPYDSTIVEFPDGTVIYGASASDINDETAEKGVKVRSQDISFLIDQILQPSGLGEVLDGFDTGKIFIYGHSLGGATSAQVVFNDDRVLGGLDLDGKLYGNVSETGLDRPLFVVGADSTEEAASYFKGIMGKVDAAKTFLTVNGTKHMSFVDLPLVLSLLNFAPPGLEAAIGTIEGKKMASITDDILGAVTSFLFKGKTQPLCQLEDKVEEVVVVVRDLKRACH
ncbi:hypothetical protein N0V84_000186 [Fusarium piperis]|uniref:1-alkyl-2-acetylglycerophosphocholine esterase n=1 Tax=Fusarium piperis TaxID=1435070 RepID=A0A9W8WNJ2_9HYPO|nr:hypothetical protein N0V84_000186 [Fusarium piperis]